jgi:hypothetical protein
MSVQALSQALGCSEQSIKRWVEKHDVKRLVIGGKWLLRLDDFENVVERSI